jgi:hypothetical protein
MQKSHLLVAVVASVLWSEAALADLFTLTNGVVVAGTVVSGMVAQVAIRDGDGTIRTIPVSAFNPPDRERLPWDAAGIYVAYAEVRDVAKTAMAENEKLLSEMTLLKGHMEKLSAATERLTAAMAEPKQGSATASAREVSRSAGYVNVAWKAEIPNQEPEAIKRDVVFRFLDEDGFVVKSEREYDVVLSPGVTKVAQVTIIKADVYDQVKTCDVLVEE